MPIETHSFMDGKLHVYKRENSTHWQCSTYLNGRNYRVTTKEENLSIAKDFAIDWYMETYVEAKRERTGYKFKSPTSRMKELGLEFEKPISKTVVKGPTFKEAADKFLEEYGIITQGQRNAVYAKGHELRINVHLMPFFKNIPLNQITAGTVQEYRTHRYKNGHKGKIPARATLHTETVTLRLVLKTAHRYGWINQLPDISAPYKISGKVSHRAWFSPDEYKMLYEATRERAKNPKRERYRALCEDLHDYVLFMANTGLRPDEAGRLEYRDVTIVTDKDSGERLLEIEVRGKRGVGYCKSMTGAIIPFQRMQQRHTPKASDKIFGKTPRELLNKILEELNLKFDRDGNVRTAYSLRHTYICMRLMEGADIYQVAKNCRTSVEMIEKFYAVHLKNTLNASAINVRKPKIAAKKPVKKTKKKPI